MTQGSRSSDGSRYSPVEKNELRMDLYSALIEYMTMVSMQNEDVVNVGDFDAHPRGHKSEETNSNGRLLDILAGHLGMEIQNLDGYTTFLGRKGGPTWNYYILLSRSMQGLVQKEGILPESVGSDHAIIYVELQTSRHREKSKTIELDIASIS